MLEMSGKVPLLKDMEDKLRVQFQNQAESTKKITKVDGEPNPQFQNEMGSINTMTERLPLMPKNRR
jgi:hypothetical protein